MWPSFNPWTVANWIFIPHLSLVFEACGYSYFIILLSSVISFLVWTNLDPKSSKCLNIPQKRLSDLSLIKNSDTFHPSYFIRLMFPRQDLDRWGLKTHENHWQITRVCIFFILHGNTVFKLTSYYDFTDHTLHQISISLKAPVEVCNFYYIWFWNVYSNQLFSLPFYNL